MPKKKAGASAKLSGEWRFSPKERTYGQSGGTRMFGARASVSDALKPMQRPNAEGMAPKPSMSEPGTWTYLPLRLAEAGVVVDRRMRESRTLRP